MKHKITNLYDYLGISSATICMIHCLVFPFLAVLPFGLSNDVFIDIIFACIGLYVVSKVLLTNAPVVVKSILSISIILICVTVFLHILFQKESPLFLVGGGGMIVGHLLNFLMHKKCL